MKTTNKTIKRILSFALCLALVISYVPKVSMRADAAVSDLTVTIDTGASVTLKDTDGDDYYEIGTVDELYAFAAAINAGNTNINVELTANINLNSGYTFNSDGTVTYDGDTVTSGYVSWLPIGNADNVYAGVLDGANKTISGLYFNGSAEYVGFFAYMGGTIKNLNLTNAYFENSVSTSQTKAYVGGFSAYSTGNFNNCSFNGTVLNEVCYVAYAGGISAYSQGGFVDCVNNGTITANTTDQSGYVGGIVGVSKGSIMDCLNTGIIFGAVKTYGYFGGIVGEAYGKILNSTNTGVVSGNTDLSSRVGGIAGFVYTEVLVDRCTNTADLNAESRGYASVGGVAGGSYGTITNCCNFGDVTASADTFSSPSTAEPSGIVGNTTGGSISFCYSVGSMTAKKGSPKYPAGIVGRVYNDTVLTSNFYCSDGASYGIGYDYATELGGDISGKAEGKTLEQFNSGEVAYHLQQGELSSTGNITPVWGQDLDNGKTVQKYPNFTGGVVYYSDLDGYTNFSIPVKNAEGIYELDCVEEMVWFSKHINNGTIPRNTNAILTADIDMSGIDWTPICSTGLYYNTTEYTDKGYEGVFDGNGFVIKNLALKGTNGVNCTVGLFGTLSGTVKNLGMDGVTFDLNGATDVRAAGIAGQMLDGSLIENCYVVNSTLTPGLYIVGGVAGCNYAGTIRNCFTKNVTISANERCGNLVSDCRGDINGTDRIGTVENCWTDAGRVVGTQSVAEYIVDSHTNAGGMFENGAVAYNLGEAWGQNLDNDEANQGHPVINGAKVYFNGYNGCPEYSNSESTTEHNFVNGICSVCSLYEAAVVVSESNYEELELSADYVGYYAVANAGQLFWYSKNHGDIVNLVLVEDIEIGKDIIWKPLSNSVKIFDGAGHTITIEQDHSDTETSSNYGLFSELNVGTIKNLILNGSIKIKTSGHVGALSGSMYESAIENVISYVDITNLGTGNTGGLSGYYGGRDPSVINNCAVYANISGGGNTGGIIGSGWGGTRFYRIYNTAVVGTVSGTTAGALVGYSATGNSGGSFYPSSVRFENIYYNVGDSDILTVGAWATNGGVSCETMAKFVSVEAKTAEQFASGEVAYLLQQGNTEQVWGQESNTEGSLPVLTDNELYKVVEIGETGNYSVANIGDTNGDGTVDVIDYQALINTILADDHEQIEAASYDDIIRYDLDGDGYLDVIDASLMHNFINGFITVDVYAVGDYDCNGVAFEESDLKAIKYAIANPEVLSTSEKYACDINKDGKFDSLDISFLEETYGEIENTSCEDNLKITYSWANDYSTCTATAKCSLCGKMIAIETVNTEYYYEESEWEIYTSYTARFENEFFEEKNVEFREYKNYDETTTEFIGGGDGFFDW